jgi:death on curing protein
LAEVLAAHEFALTFGGLAGVRDLGSIEAAIAAAKKAAALVHSLALNHGFIDGNKRTALLMAYLFLRRSGYDFDQADERRLNREIEDMILAVVDHSMTFDQITDWFSERIFQVDE